MKIKPSLPKGMRDFLPSELAGRNYIVGVIRDVYEKFGFQEISTPVMENLSTLTGKYGEEGDKLLFKVLNSGDYLRKVDEGLLSSKDSRKITSSISEKGLRYDLTVPLARFVVQHQNELAFPFKRYHIAPVWRADRPQKGRYREFYQCDADIIGSKSLLNEVELVQIIAEVFDRLKLKVTIRYNNRKILVGMMEELGLKNASVQAIAALDKLDKIGIDKVLTELAELGMKEDKASSLRNAIENNDLSAFNENEEVEKGLAEIAILEKYASGLASFDLSLARGLDYYTGCIFEVVSDEFEIGSLSGGGRYDDLTELFGKSDMTGVGISFGLDRIYDVLQGLDRFPEETYNGSQVLFTHFDDNCKDHAFELLQELRKAGIASELYPDVAKMNKQMKYADKKSIPIVCVIGDEEMRTGMLSVKFMVSGEQTKMRIEELIAKLKNSTKDS